MKKLLTSLAVAAFAATATIGSAFSADYPERPISVMVSYGAGGATDFQARIVTMVSAKEELLGQPSRLELVCFRS